MPLSSVSASASAFMCATISSMPSWASVTTAVTRPLASKRGEKTAPSSSAFLFDGASGNSSADIAGPCLARPAGRSDPAAAHHGDEADLLFWRILEDAGEGRGQRGGALL